MVVGPLDNSHRDYDTPLDLAKLRDIQRQTREKLMEFLRNSGTRYEWIYRNKLESCVRSKGQNL